MRALKYRELKRMVGGMGERAFCTHLKEALEEKHLAPEDIGFRDLWEALYGREGLDRIDPRKGDMVLEWGGEGAIHSTTFANITGQLVMSKILEAYRNPEFTCTSLVDNIPSRIKDTEVVGGINRLGDKTEVVKEGQNFPHAGFGEDYTTIPAKVKRGLIVSVTKETIFFDLTGEVLRRAGEVGHSLGIDKEKRIANVIAGITNPYNWLGNALNTYYDPVTSPTAAAATGLAIWINIHGNALEDWTDIDAAEQLFARMRDPFTGEPILVTGKRLLVMPQLYNTAKMIVNATEIRRDNTVQRTFSQSPIQPYPVEKSEFLYAQCAANGWTTPEYCWWFGDFKKAFGYYENWPITVSQAPPSSEAEFNQDIVARYKASERGVAAVKDPRYILRSCRGIQEDADSSSSGEFPR